MKLLKQKISVDVHIELAAYAFDQISSLIRGDIMGHSLVSKVSDIKEHIRYPHT